MKSRRVFKHPFLANHHHRCRLTWGLAQTGCNLRTWQRVHQSDEAGSRSMSQMTDWEFGGIQIRPPHPGTYDPSMIEFRWWFGVVCHTTVNWILSPSKETLMVIGTSVTSSCTPQSFFWGFNANTHRASYCKIYRACLLFCLCIYFT